MKKIEELPGVSYADTEVDVLWGKVSSLIDAVNELREVVSQFEYQRDIEANTPQEMYNRYGEYDPEHAVGSKWIARCENCNEWIAEGEPAKSVSAEKIAHRYCAKKESKPSFSQQVSTVLSTLEFHDDYSYDDALDAIVALVEEYFGKEQDNGKRG